MIQSKFKVVWEGNTPSLTEEQRMNLENEVKVLEENVGNDASKLIFHTVAVDSELGYSGPLIHVSGKKDVTDSLFYFYESNPTWVIERVRNGEIVKDH
jgi:hypothetical protein